MKRKNIVGLNSNRSSCSGGDVCGMCRGRSVSKGIFET
jgi:hypothetical protein